MKAKFSTITMVLFGLVALLVVGCGSDNEKAARPGIVNEMVDSVASTVAKNLRNAERTGPTQLVVDQPEEVKVITEVADLLLDGSQVYGVFDGGVAVYDLSEKTYSVIPSGEKLNAVARHEDKVYVGGDNLYTVNDSSLEKVEAEFEGVITSLYSYGYRLMIGTECGLHSTGMFGHELIYADIPVSAMAADESGLWVGTRGEGLYRWDGENFRRRFLARDTSFFDNVNALDFNHRHLYMGTTNGLHVFDGGSWKTLTSLDGLPADNVTAIDASQWMVYVGTDEGVISYFNGDFFPVNSMEATKATSFVVDGRKVIAATEFDGIVMKSGNVLKTLVPADNGLNYDILSLIP